MSRLAITDSLLIEEREIALDFIRASGPGGQKVNKASSAVQLRFDIRASPSLPEPVKARAERLAGARLTSEGVIVITARRFRSQERNRADALARLGRLLARAERPPVQRRATRPPIASRRERLAAKARRSAAKGLRARPSAEE